jgi:hypothetical protein
VYPEECEVYRPALDLDTATFRKSAYALCQIARHPAANRLDKVLAVDTVINARHNSGPFFEHLCNSTQAASSLVDTVLDMLYGDKQASLKDKFTEDWR